MATKISYKDTISAVAEKSGITKVKAREVIDNFKQVLIENTKAGNNSAIGDDFGTLKVVNKAARKAKVPGTDKTVDVPASVTVKLSVSKNLKSQLN